jgi:hypothetical protein
VADCRRPCDFTAFKWQKSDFQDGRLGGHKIDQIAKKFKNLGVLPKESSHTKFH